MNKFVLGLMVLLVGGAIGWYYFGAKTNLPSPAPTGVNEEATITEESPVTGEATVTYTNNGYTPTTLTVKKGTTVTFRNESSGGMWTASAVHPTHQLLPGFDQKKSVVKGGTYEYTFTKVGTWKYHNHVNPTDTAVVVVTE